MPLTRDASVTDLFLELVAVPSPSRRERVLGESIREWLAGHGVTAQFERRGLRVETDQAAVAALGDAENLGGGAIEAIGRGEKNADLMIAAGGAGIGGGFGRFFDIQARGGGGGIGLGEDRFAGGRGEGLGGEGRIGMLRGAGGSGNIG